MKKTININLGGLAFIIDENAFEVLHNYIEALKKKFNNAAERDEIINDIESRMAEMLNQKLANRKEVIETPDVEAVIAAMGKPEDIAGDEPAGEQQESTPNNAGANTSSQGQTKKRLFRDPDDIKVGGVISGLCHYFGIHDPVWARIAAVVLIPLTSGSVILLYFLLMVLVPKANTSAEKLQMKGEPVNISTIEKEVKDAANRFSETVKSTVQADGFFERLAHFAMAIFMVFLRLVGLFIVIFAMGSLIALLGSFFGTFAFGMPTISDWANRLSDSHSNITMFTVGIIMVSAIPLIGLAYWGLRILIGQRSGVRWFSWTLFGLWIVGLILVALSAYSVAINFRQSVSIKETYALTQPAGNTMYAQLADSTEHGWSALTTDEDDDDDDVVVVNGIPVKGINHLKLGRAYIQLIPSENDSFSVQEIITARGYNKADAEKNAGMVLYTFAQNDTVLNLNKHYSINNEGSKWRGQNMKLRLAIPKGKFMHFAGNIDQVPAVVKGDNYYDETKFANTTWTNDNGIIKCLNCDQPVNGNKHGHTANNSKSNDDF